MPPAAAPTAPANPPATGPRPKLVLDRSTYDFGVAKQEAEVDGAVVLTNAGDATLHIRDIRASCGCSEASLLEREIPPGESRTLVLKFRTYTMSGEVVKHVRIFSDDPERPEVEVILLVDIAAGIVVEPSGFYYGQVEVGQAPSVSLKVKWRDGTGTPFRLAGLEAPGLDLDVTSKPFEAGAWHGYELTARFRKPPPVGTVSGTVIVRTDLPERPRLLAHVTAYVSGKVWLDRRDVSIGMLPAGKPRTVMVGCRGLTTAVDLGEVKAVARKGQVAARAIRSGKEWLIEVSVPPTTAAGRIDDVVEVTCSIPGEAAAEIRVKGEVLGAPKGAGAGK